jgi:hypothetical protein
MTAEQMAAMGWQCVANALPGHRVPVDGYCSRSATHRHGLGLVYRVGVEWYYASNDDRVKCVVKYWKEVPHG